jgi:hypothetical protein
MATKTIQDVRDFFSSVASSISMHFIEGTELDVVNNEHAATSIMAFMMPASTEDVDTATAAHALTIYACARSDQSTHTGDNSNDHYIEKFKEIENKFDVQMKSDLASDNDIWLSGEVRKQRLPAQANELWFMVRYDMTVNTKYPCFY